MTSLVWTSFHELQTRLSKHLCDITTLIGSGLKLNAPHTVILPFHPHPKLLPRCPPPPPALPAFLLPKPETHLSLIAFFSHNSSPISKSRGPCCYIQNPHFLPPPECQSGPNWIICLLITGF